jgi:hypothetical protein
MALTYILPMRPNLEARNKDGLTPLHVAISQAERLESTRNVRVLLLRGADRDAKDNEGRKPVDVIPDSMPPHMDRELRTFLGKQSYCECLMFRSPMVPLKRNHRTQALFLTLFAIVFVLNFLIINPPMQYYGRLIQYLSVGTTAFVLLTFFYASCKSAGVVKRDKNKDFLTLLRDVNPADLCPECQVIRTARSRHCPICNVCVDRFDHHCPWINNCVGIHNHNGFMVFLFAIWAKISYHLVIDVWAFYEAFQGDGLDCQKSGDVDDCELLCLKVQGIRICENFWIKQSANVVCILICLFYLLLSTVMLCTHCKNYAAYRTTNERLSKRGGKKSKASMVSEDRGSMVESESAETSLLTYDDVIDS